MATKHLHAAIEHVINSNFPLQKFDFFLQII